jgi:hypothetical protein
MPTSIDPLPGENEFECANCGALVYYELTRCPECGVNLYEPEDDLEEEYYGGSPTRGGLLTKVGDFFRRLVGKPYSAEEVFGDALDQAALYHDLLVKVGGDHQVVDRLIEFERKEHPNGNRLVWLQNAIQRWERDNRVGRGIES